MTVTQHRPAAEVHGTPPTFGHFIAGEWRDGVSGETFESRNPADTRDVMGRFQAGTPADVAMAIKAAETASPLWSRTPAPKRGEILYRFGELMAEHKERLAQAMTREMGKVIAEARGDVQEGIDIAFLMAGEGRRLFGDTCPSELPDKWAMSIRQPIGVARDHHALELPDGDPVLEDDAGARGRQHRRLQAGERHAALRDAPRRADGRGRLPGRAVNLVTGAGADVGDAIVDSPDVPVISFTGSSATGKRSRSGRRGASSASASSSAARTAIVVMADADLDLATDGILWSAFGTTGQRCTAAAA